jgi:serine/threonine protein kinase
MAAPATLQEFGALVVRSKLMTADDLKGALKGLRSTGSEAGDVEAARRHLVASKHLTEYQAALLVRGHPDGFFLGPYRVIDRIGKGRMAGVYKGRHESGQIVAIKVLPASRARDPELLARFQREGRLLTRLDHPNVVRALQLGEADGKHYLVLEHLEGETLEDVLEKSKRLPVPEAVRIVHQALHGLQHLHEKGMIHRDLKPANLMLVRGDGKDPTAGTVKILDIGLGKAMFDEGEDARKITGEGVLIGTPDYLAPEQARNARGADIRSDIYSLGCVLYRTLTGQPPFPDKSILNQVMRHATEPPRPLSDFLQDVPEGLQTAMNWLLAKDPAQRYPTPERAAQALSLFLRDVAAPRPAAPEYLEAVKVAEAAPPPAIPLGKLESPGRKSATAPPPASVPTAREPEIDVELVSVPSPTRTRDERGWLELNRRDAVMLVVGGLLVSLALLAGWGLYRVLRVEPTVESPPVEPPPGPAQIVPGHPHKPGDPLEG